MSSNDTALEPLELEKPANHRGTVLIVDDDEDQAEILSVRLSKQGYLTRTALTGKRGFESALESPPDLVVLDLRLPDEDGLNICAKLTDNSRTCGIPVIIVSGMERPDIVRCSRAAGCYYFVRKPYDPNALLLLIESAIGQSTTW